MASNDNFIRSALDAGMEAGEAKRSDIDSTPYAVIPEGASLHSLEHLQRVPARIRAGVELQTVESWIAYVNKFKDDRSVVFGCPERLTLDAVIDYHDPGDPAWCEHHAHYVAPKAPEWKLWRGASGKAMAQADFAQWIEDNLVDIVNPPGADLLEMARAFRAKKDVEFVSVVDMHNGTRQLTYNQEVTGQSARRENLTMPTQFDLGIPVVFGGARYAVVARLRYRLHDGKLMFHYDLYRPEYIERDAFSDIATKVTAETGIEVWLGVS